MTRSLRLAAVALAVPLAAAGCDLSGVINTALTQAQEDLVNNALTQLQGMAGAAGATSDSADFSQPTSKTNSAATFGDCPVVTITLGGQAFSIGFDFGDACTSEEYPDVTMSGSIGGTIDFADRTLDVTMENFSAGGPAVSGTMGLDFTKASGSTVATFDAVVDLSTDGAGSLDVTAQWTYDADTGLLTIVVVDGSAQDGEASSYDLDCSNLVMDPATHGNFVPQSGTMTLIVNEPTGPLGTNEENTIVVTFDENSPVTGQVQVSVNGGGSFTHTLEGF